MIRIFCGAYVCIYLYDLISDRNNLQWAIEIVFWFYLKLIVLMNSNFDLNHYETGFLLLKSLIDHGVLGNVDAKLYVVKLKRFKILIVSYIFMHDCQLSACFSSYKMNLWTNTTDGRKYNLRMEKLFIRKTSNSYLKN